MLELLLAFMPDEALPVIIVGLGFALILGIISRSVVFSILGTIILFALLSPFIDALFDSLPLWLLLLIMLIVGFTLLKFVMTTLFGKEATGHVLGQLLMAIFILPFRILGLLIRGRRRA